MQGSRFIWQKCADLVLGFTLISGSWRYNTELVCIAQKIYTRGLTRGTTMKLPIDIASGPPSWQVINDLRVSRQDLRKKVAGLSTWSGLLAVVCYGCAYLTKSSWAVPVFAVALVVFAVSYQYEKRMQAADDRELGEVPAELSAQLFVYCQATPAAAAYKESVIKERRKFIMAEYNALQTHARAAGSDEGVSALYSAKG